MKVLYYMQPWSIHGGDGNVARYLTETLVNKVDLTRFPDFSFPIQIIKTYQKFFRKEYKIIHFNTAPSLIYYYFTTRWMDGNYLLLKYAKKMGAKTILNIHGITLLEHDKQQQRFIAGKTKVIANAGKKVDKIIINAEHMRRKVINCYEVDNEKIAVIPNGVNLNMFQKKQKNVFLSGNPAILFVGHICWVKGIDILFDAMARLKDLLPNARLHLVGADLENAKLVVKQKNLENQVFFHGPIPHSRIPEYYKAATISVLPSRHEGFPIVMLETMASGTPFICSDIDSFKEVLKNGENALIFKSEDSLLLANAIIKLFEDLSLRKKIVQGAFLTVQNYGWDKIADQYIQIYEEICA